MSFADRLAAEEVTTIALDAGSWSNGRPDGTTPVL